MKTPYLIALIIVVMGLFALVLIVPSFDRRSAKRKIEYDGIQDARSENDTNP